MINAIMLTPNLSYGGAERWVVSLIKNSDPDRVRWLGVALSGWGAVEPELCEEVTQFCPLFAEKKITKTQPSGGPTPASLSPDCEQYVQRVPNLKTAIERASGGIADVVVGWGSTHYRSFLKGTSVPHFVYVSHSSHHKPQPIEEVDWCKTHLVAVSEAAKHPVSKTSIPVEVIYNGAQTDRLHSEVDAAEMKRRWGVPETANVIGYIGRQSTEKNPCAAARALTILDGWHGVYYGSFPAGKTKPPTPLRNVVDQLGGRCQLYEPVPHIGDVYAGLDVLMLASVSEAFSLTLIEAWLSGIPVVATPVGSIPELECKYHRDLVIKVPQKASPERLAAACRRAVSEEGREIAKHAKEIATAEFTASAMGSRWADYLEARVTKKPERTTRLELDL